MNQIKVCAHYKLRDFSEMPKICRMAFTIGKECQIQTANKEKIIWISDG